MAGLRLIFLHDFDVHFSQLSRGSLVTILPAVMIGHPSPSSYLENDLKVYH